MEQGAGNGNPSGPEAPAGRACMALGAQLPSSLPCCGVMRTAGSLADQPASWPPTAAHPVAADAKVTVAQLDGLLRGDDRLLLVPVVNLASNGREYSVSRKGMGKLLGADDEVSPAAKRGLGRQRSTSLEPDEF